MTPDRRNATRRPTRGFTLAELLVALMVTAVLMTAVGSTLVLATRALPDTDGPAQRVVTSAKALGAMAEELRSALYITEQTATAITFVTPDRNGDGAPEVIRYAWSATPGDPLTRRANGGTVHDAVAGVQQFALTYELTNRVTTFAGAPATSARQQLAGFVTGPGLTDVTVSSTQWGGQYFKPTLPANALSWSVEEVQIHARAAGILLGSTQVQLRPADAGNLPTAQVLEEKTVLELSLPILTAPFTWWPVSFSNVTNISPDQGLCMLAMSNDADPSAQVRYFSGSPTFANGALLLSAGSGNPWSADNTKALRMMVYGRYVAPGPDQALTRQHVQRVHAQLCADAQGGQSVEAMIAPLNQPPVLTAAWDADFACNPLKLDFDMNGQTEWATAPSPTFDEGTLSGGLWNSTFQLRSPSSYTYTTPLTVDARLRDTTTGGSGAGVALVVDRTGSGTAAIFLYAVLQADGTQTLTLQAMPDMSTAVTLATVPGLSGGFIDLKLILNPAADQINVNVNGQDRGTYAYVKMINQLVTWIVFYPPNSDNGAVFDYVRVLMGGTIANAPGS